MTRFIHACFLILIGHGLAGCTTLHFLQQASVGQLRIAVRAQPLDEVTAASETDPAVAELLREVPQMKAFAEAHGLKPTANYTRYMPVEGSAIVWVVTACDPLEFAPKTWRFPVVGGFSYLGWFHEKHARAHAERLRRRGWDVYVRGAAAYSTLGWFRDPIFSSMIPETDDARGALAEAIFHESVHATIHIKNQSRFNESLAQFAGEGLAFAYLDSASAYGARLERVRSLSEKMQRAYAALSAAYGSEVSDDAKLAEKKRILGALQAELGLTWEPNNAVLLNYITYDSGRSDFDRLLEDAGGAWAEFFSRLDLVSGDAFSTGQQENFGEVLSNLRPADE